MPVLGLPSGTGWRVVLNTMGMCLRMQRLLVVIGLLAVLAGLFWPWVSRVPWGRLPGDFSFRRGGTSVYFPLMTTLLVSVLVSLLLRLFRK